MCVEWIAVCCPISYRIPKPNRIEAGSCVCLMESRKRYYYQCKYLVCKPMNYIGTKFDSWQPLREHYWKYAREMNCAYRSPDIPSCTPHIPWDTFHGFSSVPVSVVFLIIDFTVLHFEGYHRICSAGCWLVVETWEEQRIPGNVIMLEVKRS